MQLLPNQIEFLEHCKQGRTFALEMGEPLVVHHYDADGLSSGALVCSALKKENKKFRRMCIKKLDDKVIDGLKDANEQEIIFVDLGSGNPRVNELKKVLIIDHHQPVEELKYRINAKENKFHVNPMLFGVDGGNELSAASTAFCVFQERVDLAITGAVGDMQTPLEGMNRWVLEKGIEEKEIILENDLGFYGRHTRSLVQFLAYSDDPYIPTMSYRDTRVVQLLGSLGIELKEGERWRTYSELNENEKKKLISAIAEIMIKFNMQNKAKNLIGECYVFPKNEKNETYEANEFSTVLNACGRHDADEVGVALCLKEDGAYEKAVALLQLHRKKLREGIEFANTNMIDLGKVYLVDGRGLIDEGIIGVICGMALQSKGKKPILGLADGENNTLKISMRGTKQLVEDGLNLSNVLKKSCEGIGIGGGHAIAAGASIQKDKLNEFLMRIAKEL
ncbi:MAG: DHH family phosphoesterase [Candidatus Micrarchaeota archaeon]|nr:DHH family phosphoesterase [Candidatus Micrarchaeota archaeon]